MTAHRPLQTVVVAHDLSPAAKQIVDRATWLPWAPKGAVHLVHVVPEHPRRRRVPSGMTSPKDMLSMVAAHLRPRLEKRAGAAIKVKTQLLEGAPYLELIRYARSVNAELVLVGAHGRRKVRDLFAGTTASRVIRKGDVPVLLVNQGAIGPYQRPLLALDLLEGSRHVLDFALRLLPDASALRVVHAYEVPFEGAIAGNVSAARAKAYREECRREALELSTLFLEQLGPDAPKLDVVVREGETRAVILRETVRHRADVVVLGTHARSGRAHVLLGHVPDAILREAPCDVAVTRPEHFEFVMP